MAGSADLVVLGFGSWSTVERLPTLGFTSAETTPPLDGVIEYTVSAAGANWTTADTRIEWTLGGPD